MAKKKPTVDNESYVLPANNKELQSFVDKYKVDMTEQVISSIEFAVKNKLPIIEVFQFKGSKFVVTVTTREFESNLENIYNYYLNNEHYELCPRVAKLLTQVKTNRHEKKKNSIIGNQ